MENERALTPPCAAHWWTFAVPVIVGNIAGRAAERLVKAHHANAAEATRSSAGHFARIGTFWVAAGLTWIAICRRNE